jgi:hypothetical protein
MNKIENFTYYVEFMIRILPKNNDGTLLKWKRNPQISIEEKT